MSIVRIRPPESEYRWLAKQRPRNKRQNRILLRNAKERERLLQQSHAHMKYPRTL